jgi:hypothetical protein
MESNFLTLTLPLGEISPLYLFAVVENLHWVRKSRVEWVDLQAKECIPLFLTKTMHISGGGWDRSKTGTTDPPQKGRSKGELKMGGRKKKEEQKGNERAKPQSRTIRRKGGISRDGKRLEERTEWRKEEFQKKGKMEEKSGRTKGNKWRKDRREGEGRKIQYGIWWREK